MKLLTGLFRLARKRVQTTDTDMGAFRDKITELVEKKNSLSDDEINGKVEELKTMSADLPESDDKGKLDRFLEDFKSVKEQDGATANEAAKMVADLFEKLDTEAMKDVPETAVNETETPPAEQKDGAATVSLTVANLPSHNHSYTPSGTVTSTFKGSSHSHTFTPSGTVKSTFKGTSHSHTFTPSGSISDTTAKGAISGGAYKFTGTWKNTGDMNENATGTFLASTRWVAPSNWSGENYASGNVTRRKITHYGNTGGENSEDSKYTINVQHKHSFLPEGSISVTTNPIFTGTSHGHTFTGKSITTSATQGGTVASTFTGTQQTVSATQGGTVSSSFTGTAGTTGSTGSGTSINIMPPYVVKYCWERTA